MFKHFRFIFTVQIKKDNAFDETSFKDIVL